MHARGSKALRLVVVAVALAMVAAACGGDDEDTGAGAGGGGGEKLSGVIRIDGSSTVAPLSEAAAEQFRKENSDVQVTVGTSGTGGGFEKFCNGETDISDASRPIKKAEIDACKAKGIAYEEVAVANDGLSVVVNPQNTWAKCLTVEQLKKIWEPSSKISNWNQVDPSFPNEKLTLFGAGTDSGTFDYFTEAINGKEGASRTDYNATEDDNVTVQGVSGNKGALGYFGLSYLNENASKVKGVEINCGQGCVAPTEQTVQDGTYKPLGRPLFIYPAASALQRPEVKAFVEFYIDQNKAITEQAKFVPLTDQQLTQAKQKVDRLTGTAG